MGLSLKHDDIGQNVQIAFVVATKDSANLIVGAFTRRHIFNIDEHGDAVQHGNAVAAAIHRINITACSFSTRCINVDVDESVGLYGLVGGVAIVSAIIIVVGTVAAAIHSIDSRFASDADIGLNANEFQIG